MNKRKERSEIDAKGWTKQKILSNNIQKEYGRVRR